MHCKTAIAIVPFLLAFIDIVYSEGSVKVIRTACSTWSIVAERRAQLLNEIESFRFFFLDFRLPFLATWCFAISMESHRNAPCMNRSNTKHITRHLAFRVAYKIRAAATLCFSNEFIRKTKNVGVSLCSKRYSCVDCLLVRARLCMSVGFEWPIVHNKMPIDNHRRSFFLLLFQTWLSNAQFNHTPASTCGPEPLTNISCFSHHRWEWQTICGFIIRGPHHTYCILCKM